MNSPVRLGVSPAAFSSPTGVFSQWFEALFPCPGTLGCAVCHPVHQLLPRQPAAAWPALFNNLPPRWVHQPPPCRESSLPQQPVSAPPTSLDECFFFICLVSDFLAILFSVSSGCARRHSVSTYASILAGSQIVVNFEGKKEAPCHEY